MMLSYPCMHHLSSRVWPRSCEHFILGYRLSASIIPRFSLKGIKVTQHCNLPSGIMGMYRGSQQYYIDVGLLLKPVT